MEGISGYYGPTFTYCWKQSLNILCSQWFLLGNVLVVVVVGQLWTLMYLETFILGPLWTFSWIPTGVQNLSYFIFHSCHLTSKLWSNAKTPDTTPKYRMTRKKARLILNLDMKEKWRYIYTNVLKCLLTPSWEIKPFMVNKIICVIHPNTFAKIIENIVNVL